MFRNQYDGDVTTWSPQGRLHQVEYAMEAVKQGSATVGIRSKTHAVLVARKRAANDLCSHQKKIVAVDDHCAVSIAGLLSDGRILARFLQKQCSSHKYQHKEAVPLPILEDRLTYKLQGCTQGYGHRPFGVGLLLAGVDESGAHIYRVEPNAEITECIAMAIGGRSQSARTYLEKHVKEFQECSLDELLKHALLALRDTIPAEEDLTAKNTSIAFVAVGPNEKFTCLEDDATTPYLQKIADVPRARAAAQALADQQPGDAAGGQDGAPPAQPPADGQQPPAE